MTFRGWVAPGRPGCLPFGPRQIHSVSVIVSISGRL
jgi:hypothetical protein